MITRNRESEINEDVENQPRQEQATIETETTVPEHSDSTFLSGAKQAGQGSLPASHESTRSFAKQLQDITYAVKKSLAGIDSLEQQVKEIKASDYVIAELSERCRSLTEQFHEREVLFPVCCCLIGITARCRQQINKIEGLLQKHSNNKDESSIRALKYLADARKADLVELDNMLANLGVEPYEHNEDTFEPSLQKCIRRIESKDETLHGYIAQRLLPGYKRDNKGQ